MRYVILAVLWLAVVSCAAHGVTEDYTVIEARADAAPCYPREGHALVSCEDVCKGDRVCVEKCQCVEIPDE